MKVDHYTPTNRQRLATPSPIYSNAQEPPPPSFIAALTSASHLCLSPLPLTFVYTSSVYICKP